MLNIFPRQLDAQLRAASASSGGRMYQKPLIFLMKEVMGLGNAAGVIAAHFGDYT